MRPDDQGGPPFRARAYPVIGWWEALTCDRMPNENTAMPTESQSYQNPLVKRYASAEMLRIFSDDNRYRTWRKLWLALAESEAELGLDISEVQLDELRAHLDDIDYDRVA